MKYNEGEIVTVKIAGLDVSGIIKEKKKTGEYIIQFDGGAEKLVSERNIKPVDSKVSKSEILNSPSRRSPSRRPPARAASPSRRSPARAASPSRRAKGKSPSPSRRKSPSRRSQPRILKLSLDNIEMKEDSPSNLSFPRRRRPIEHNSEVTKFNSVTETVTEKVFEINNGFESNTVVDGVIKDKFEGQNIIHLASADDELKDLETYSDDEVLETEPVEVVEKLRKSEPRSFYPEREFGGWIGALCLIFLMPGFLLGMHVFCNKDFCSYTQLPDLKQYKLLNAYIDVQAFSLYFGYIALMACLMKLPFGGKQVVNVTRNCKKESYCLNGFFSIFVVHAVVAGLEWCNVPVINTLYEKYFQLLITAILFGCTLATLIYIRSKFVPLSCLNIHGVTNNFIYDFFVGRETNPRLVGITVKTLLFRSSLISVFVINSLFIFKSLNVTVSSEDTLSFDKISCNPALLVTGMLQIIYIFDVFFFESTFATSSFELQSEGVGYYLCLMYSLYPFMLTAGTKYFYDYNTAISPWLILASCIMFTVGYVLFRGANSQKNAFRLNPFDAALAHLKTMPTSQGKKLIISGYWGLVRHPNYIGDILIHLAIGVLCVTTPAALGVLPSTVLLVHRPSRMDARCKRRYGSYWDKYCQKVRYQLIPKIY